MILKGKDSWKKNIGGMKFGKLKKTQKLKYPETFFTGPEILSRLQSW